MLRSNGVYQMIEGTVMTKKVVGLLALTALCLSFSSGYIAAAERASQQSSGYKLLYFPVESGAMSRLTGNQGIPKDALNGCVPMSISSSPDPANVGLLILC